MATTSAVASAAAAACHAGRRSGPSRRNSARTGSAATSYEVWLSTDGAAYTKLSTTASSATWNLPRGHSYQFAARALDANGITSQWAYGTAFAAGEYDSTRWMRGT